jgi:hypothetical protein
MSVINKVLRDLDQRLSSKRTNPLQQSAAPGSPLRLDTRSILAKGRKENPPLWQVLVVGGITLFIVGQAVWWWVKPAPIAPPPPMPIPRLQPVVATPPAPIVAVSAPIPASAPILASAPAVVTSAPAQPAASASKAIAALPKPIQPKAAASATGTASAATPPQPKPSASASADATALALRDAVRQQLARGDYTGIWNTLGHLEESPKNSDLWAIRANAAQRLGRHQECVHAYLVALEANPNEPRWLLGAAVSLAALGKTTQASEMAERARGLAPINKDVLNYLRQSGVSLND